MENKDVILIADDSELHRAIIKGILQSVYDVEEASTADEAILMMREHGNRYSLLLLDNYMPGMKGIDMLSVMAENHWLYTLPVIMISSEKNDELVSRAYELGVSDFIYKPFNSSTVLHRIQRVIQVNKRRSEDFDDAFEIISESFYNIMRVNLSNDSYHLLRVSEEQKVWKYGLGAKASLAFKSFMELDSIYADDRANFEYFLDFDRIKARFEKGERYICIRYRRKMEDSFRWSLLEVTAAREYSKDHQIVILSSKDIHENYLSLRKGFAYLTIQAESTDYCNLTRNLVYHDLEKSIFNPIFGKCQTFTEALFWYSDSFPDPETKKIFLSTFEPSNLIRKCQEGQNTVSFTHSYQDPDGEYRLLRTSVNMFKEFSTGEIEAVFYVEDDTKEYVRTGISEILYERDYSFIGIINTTRRHITVFQDKRKNRRILQSVNSYDEFVETDLQDVISEKQKEYPLRVSVENLMMQLEKNEIYKFPVKRVCKDELTNVYLQSYSYFLGKKNLILCLYKDITDTEDMDSVTECYNGQGFERRARELFRNNPEKNYMILHFDIKEFKGINGLLGYEEGNSILKWITQILVNSRLRPMIVARQMADQFVCLIEKQNFDTETMLKICRLKYQVYGRYIPINLHCGIYEVQDLNETILSMCDKARIAEKNIKNEFAMPFVMYHETMNDAYFQKTVILSTVFDALKNHEFKVFYQPVYDAISHELVSAEALVRWVHPTEGIVSPGLFIPALEEKGTISQLDLYITQNVHSFLNRQNNLGKKIVPISMNLSRMDFINADMIKTVLYDVENSQLDKEYFRFEVTESALIDTGAMIDTTLASLRDLGAKILIDDFGSGYSSLGSLSEQKFDMIKMDMSFVRNIGKNKNTEHIILSMIEMIHRLGAKVIAEGVETKQQLDFLTQSGCDYIQGYYFSKPLPEEEFEKLLN